MFDRSKEIEDLTRDEGFRAKVYDDHTGKEIGPGTRCEGWPTIGIGWNLVGNPLSLARAKIILGWHIDDTASALFKALPWASALDEVRCRALLNMAFNLGVPKLLGFHATLNALNAGRWADAARHALESQWATQVGQRAKRIAYMFEHGKEIQ